MKKLSLLSLIFSFIFPLIIGLSTLSIPFALIDDGELIKVSGEFINRTKVGDFLYFFKNEPENGRIRPFFWFVSFLPYAISGPNPITYHVLHLLIMCLSPLLIFKIIYALSKSNLGALVGSLGYTLVVAPAEIWHRLGTQEPIITALLLFAFYKIVKLEENGKKVKSSIFWILLSLSLATLTKETVVAIIPGLILLIVFSVLVLRKITLFVQSLILITLSQIAFVLGLFFLKNLWGINGSYSQQLTLDKTALIYNFNQYLSHIQKDTGLLLPISLIILLIISLKKRDFNLCFMFFFLTISVSFLVLQLPWIYPLGRYLPPIYMGLFLFIGCSFSYLFKILKRIKFIGPVLIIVFIFYTISFFFDQTNAVLKEINSGKQRAEINAEMVKKVSENLIVDSKVFFNILEGAYEYAYETDLHLKLLYKKQNLAERINPYLLPTFKNGDILVVSRQYQEFPDNVIGKKTFLYQSPLWTIYKIN